MTAYVGSSHRAATLSILGVLLACSSTNSPDASSGAESGGSPGAGGVTTSGGQAPTTGGVNAAGGVGPAGGTASGGSGGGSGGQAPATGGAGPGTGGVNPGGGGTGGAAGAVDCSGITAAGYELCASSATGCEAVFTDGAGCGAVCAAAGLACAGAAENIDGQCAADDALPPVICDSGHQSDYCRCGGSSQGTGGTGGTAGAGGTAGTAGAGGTAGTAGAGGTGGTSGGTGGISGGTGGISGGGSGGTVGGDGCPLTLEGFASLAADGQNGTYGGRDGETVTVTNQADLNRYATASEPYTIRVQGPIRLSPKGTEIRVASDKTIIGVGTSGEIVEGGFFLGSGVHNVIIRNLTIRDTFVEGDWDGKTQDFDGIQMDTAHHVWIDHCEFHHLGDGIIDSRRDTTYLTVSYNILRDHNKAFGIGWTENVTAQMTIHHNILRDTYQRNPSTDNVLRAHLFNNWLLRVESYGNYSRGATNMVLENSVFDQVNNPHYYDTGSLVAIGNIYRDTTGQRESSGSTYSVFDPSDFYDYTLHPANEVEALLTRCAGPRAGLGQ